MEQLHLDFVMNLAHLQCATMHPSASCNQRSVLWPVVSATPEDDGILYCGSPFEIVSTKD